ncbi:penicillin-binding protein 1A [Polyangium fumosum]|uniref:PBP1A family penicillin-binding protein n=1 Tax=Polyangium fumosum TaxID=889272 RepID=A0A4U1JES7_9BACT|nr:PBP1A family penicillin-binding protein [Polyangium fumosum]TKD09694.1 PBP1A family penicillin-binding protein [Polyangium fumosum]
MPADRPSEEQNGSDARKSAPSTPNEVKSAPSTPNETKDTSDDEREKRRAARRRKRTIQRWVRRAGITIVLLAAAAMLGVALTIRHYEADLPSTEELKSYRPPQVTRVMARDGQLVLGELFVERRTIVDVEAMPDRVRYAVLAAEDASFYEHKGLDYPGMLRALYKNLRGASARQGASTITQQVVKNVLLTSERTFDRKMKEVILARRIEQELTKNEILGLYLNHIYFGHGRYGIEEACRYYFGKSIRDATLAQAALLAGIVKGPSIYSPRVSLERAKKRREYVLGQMLAKGFASAEEVERARAEEVNLAPAQEEMRELAPEVVEEAKRTLRALVGPDADRGGYTITTTIDPTMQSKARGAVRTSLDGYLKRHNMLAPLAPGKREPPAFEGAPKPSGHRVYAGVVTGHDDTKGLLFVRIGALAGAVDLRGKSRYNPKDLLPSQFAKVGKVVRVSLVDPKEAAASAADPRQGAPEPGTEEPALEPAPKEKAQPAGLRLELGPQSALVAIDVASREIVALVGGYEGVRGGLDRTLSRRQPGSTFKAFVYAYGIHTRKFTPATLLETNPAALKGYQPNNYDESEGKTPARLREALAHSVNVAAVWSIQELGAAHVMAFAQDLGIESKLGADLSLALGAYEVTPREMAAAYAAFAAGGEYKKPRLITRITGPNGVDIPLGSEPEPKRMLTEDEAFLVNSLLRTVVERGTATRAKALDRWVAGKTGTSNQSKDAWFVGYSMDIACAVWTGFDDAAPLGAGETGAVASLPAFVDFMREAHAGKPKRAPTEPAGLEHKRIDPETGLLAYEGQENAIDEVFLRDTAPDAGVDAAPDGEADAETDEAGATDEGAEAGAEEPLPVIPVPTLKHEGPPGEGEGDHAKEP